jgi:hypothetical protein
VTDCRCASAPCSNEAPSCSRKLKDRSRLLLDHTTWRNSFPPRSRRFICGSGLCEAVAHSPTRKGNSAYGLPLVVGAIQCLLNRNLNSSVHTFCCEHEMNRASKFVRKQIAYESGAITALDLGWHGGAAKLAPNCTCARSSFSMRSSIIGSSRPRLETSAGC